MENNLKLCDYGCGRSGIYTFKNGKWCCAENFKKCPESRKNTSLKSLSLSKKIKTKRDKPKVCDYGCGKEPKYYFNGVDKWCCEKNQSSCIAQIKKESIPYSEFDNKNNYLCEFGCGEKANFISKKGKICCSKTYKVCKGITKKIAKKVPWNKNLTKEQDVRLKNLSEILKGRHGIQSWNKGLKTPEKVLEKIRISINKRNEKYKTKKPMSIDYLKINHKKFFETEEIRENPNERAEIQVRCKNPECANSKKHNGWFTPNKTQIYERIRQLEDKKGNQKSFFYCSKDCKIAFRNLGKTPYIPKNLNFIKYLQIVRLETEKQIKIYKEKIEKIDLRSKKYPIDHIFSVYDGFRSGILPYVIACYKNLRIITRTQNSVKHKKSEITMEELFSRYDEYSREN